MGRFELGWLEWVGMVGIVFFQPLPMGWRSPPTIPVSNPALNTSKDPQFLWKTHSLALPTITTRYE